MPLDLASFRSLARDGNVVLLRRRLMSDQLTPVQAYRRLVLPDERTAPSFLFESVEGGSAVGRHSFLGSRPLIEVIARGHEVEVIDHRTGQRSLSHEADPLAVPQRLTSSWRLARTERTDARTRPPSFIGGWVGYAAYDTVRYLEPEKLPFATAPPADLGLPDMHFGLYRNVVVFDQVDKILSCYGTVLLDEHDSIEAAHAAGSAALEELVQCLQTPGTRLAPGEIDLDLTQVPRGGLDANFTRAEFEAAVRRAQGYIGAGDAFQIVLSQRFQRDTTADPFDIYRALRIVNPSPYMIYLQAQGSILVASSPEILCRVEGDLVTNRPLAGTRRRGETGAADRELEQDLLRDHKERAEHVMLVDLGRNDLGRVCRVGSIQLPRLMEIERYSHVMHLSSTVTGRLQSGLGPWDALRATLPVGTVSGAPKVRAMQIIDELEPTRRGPYAGGIGMVSLSGDMDVALALRTMVIPTGMRSARGWTAYLQAGAGIVADSEPAAEYQETINKSAALGRAIDLAEQVFGGEATKRRSDEATKGG